MRNRFTRACYTLAAGVAVTTTLGLVGAGSAGAAVHHARPNATEQCGYYCFSLNNTRLGDSLIQDAYEGGGWNHKIYLRQGSNAFPYEDFEYWFTGIVGNILNPVSACGQGLLPPTSKLCLDGNYSGDPVWEASFAPYGNASDWCIGVRSAVYGAKVVLRPCGVSADTLWVGDSVNGITESDGDSAMPYINGGDTRFSNPLVLTLNTHSRRPWHQLMLTYENPSVGTVTDSKQFEVNVGPYSGS